MEDMNRRMKVKEGFQFHFIDSSNLFHPVLPVRSGNKITFPLCRSCVEEQAKPMLQDAVRGERPTKMEYQPGDYVLQIEVRVSLYLASIVKTFRQQVGVHGKENTIYFGVDEGRLWNKGCLFSKASALRFTLVMKRKHER